MSEPTEKQSEKSVKKRGPYKTKSPSRGGAREGSGRPKGSSNKVDIKDLMSDFKDRTGMTFEQFVNNEIMSAKVNGDKELVAKYILGLSKYYLNEPTQKVDVTSDGKSISVAPTFIVGTNPGFPQE